ncbi:MAG: hypothetical protein KDD51_00115 [Bdellovibrionales bacterium]|nr:hypothetical protein [Bdellovibrionales bacterium]
MAMDALEKERLRRKMALKMEAFQGSQGTVVCVSGHWVDEEHGCELCERVHGHEILILKNRKGRKLKADAKCVAEMVKFRVTDVEDLEKWLAKMGELRAEAQRRREDEKAEREAERKRLERKVIVRRGPRENA